MPRKPHHSVRPVAEAMEERVLHSADLSPLQFVPLAASGSLQQPLATETAVPLAPLREIAFVDAGVPDSETLLADLHAQRAAGRVIEVIVIGADEDGIALVGQTLAGRSDIGALHLLAHGGEAAIRLGSSWLDASTLLQRAGELAGWGTALTADADLLLYGCDVAGSAAGERFVSDLAALTGADIAASADLTGAAALGGNWTLEMHSGSIEASGAVSIVAQNGWNGLLATYVADPSKTDGSTGSLRWAIGQANANPGIDTVTLLAGTHRLTLVGTDDSNLLGDLDITGDIVFVGATSNAADTVVQGVAGSRVFDLLGGTATFSRLTISGGNGGQQGGGLHVDAGASAILNNVVLSGNSGSSGGAIANAGRLTLNQVTISGNTASSQGGGLYNAGTTTIANSTISGNNAASGAGIYGAAGTLAGSNLTISGNTATASGGGIYLNSAGWTIGSSTITANSAASGGGIWSAPGRELTLASTILASNAGGNANALQTSAGYNIDTDGSALVGGGTDLRPTVAELQLGALAANGGVTQTHALLRGSVAIDAGDPALLGTDQRGAARAGRADIGAVEAEAVVTQNGSVFFNSGSGFPVNVAEGADGSTPLRLDLTVSNGTIDLAQTIGSEFLVNTTTSKDQRTPAIAVAADGHYVVTWVSDSQDGSKDGVFARVYNADGSARSGEIVVNTTTNDDQNAPAIAIDGSGRFVIAWQSYDAGKLSYDIYARSFDANGVAISNQKRITSDGDDQVAPAVAMDAAGNVVIVYGGKGDVKSSDKDGIYARSSTYTLGNIAVETMINTTTAGVQSAPSVARNANGYVVVWQSAGQDGSGTGVYAQRFDAAGATLGTEFRVNLTTVADQKNPSIALNAAGEFVVAWESANQDGSQLGIVARRFDAAGNPLTGEVIVNATTLNDQFEPSVVLTDDGRFAVTWTSTAQDNADGKQGVYLRSFDGSGVAIGHEIRVNTTTLDVQAASSLGMAADGKMVAVWHSNNQDGNGHGVYGQRFLQPGALQYLVGDGIADPAISVTGTVTDINLALDTLRYRPNPGYAGAAALNVTVTDLSAGAFDSSFVVPIDVQKLNAAPTISLPPAQATTEDIPVVFSAANGNPITVADADADPDLVQLTVSATNGTVSLSTLAGLTVVGGANGAATVVVQGRLAALNAALDGLLYRPSLDHYGSAVVTAIVDDLGNRSVGGSYSASGSVAVTIAAVNDAPVNILPASASTTEATNLVFSTANANRIAVSDVDIFGGNLEVTLSTTMGTLKLAKTNNLSFITGTGKGGEDRITFRGTLTNINIALDGLIFTPTGIFAGTASLTMLTSDLGGSGAGGALVDRDVLEIHVKPNAQNAAPEIFDPGNQVTAEEVPLVFSTATGNPISVLDDADGLPIKVTISVTNGTLTLGTSTGGEFIVNSTTVNDQQAVDVAMTPNGEHIVVWQSDKQDGNGQGIYLQRYNDDGQVIGLETRVNSTTSGDQTAPSVAVANDGSFVVAWASTIGGGGSSANGIYIQRFAADGSALGGETRVSTFVGSPAAPSVAADAAGNFVVVWQSKDQDGDGLGIYGRRITADGTLLGGEFRVNTTTAKDQSAPVVAMADGGGFVVAWQGVRPGATDLGIYAQRYSAAGAALGGEFQVTTVTYKDQKAPAIAADSAGNFVIVWQSQDVDYNDGKFGIYGQRFAADGTPAGAQFLVNTRTPNEQTAAAVTMDSSGNFVVSWQSKNQDSRDDDAGVYAQRFVAGGARDGGEFRVNTTIAEAQTAPALAMSDNGKLLVVWTSDKQDGSGLGIYGQRFLDARSLAFSVGDGTDDATMTFTATLEQINDVLDGLIFTPAKDFADKATLTLTVDDLGRSGTGGPKVSSTNLSITVTPINDAPVITVPPPRTVVEDTPIVFSSAAGTAITVTDADSAGKKLMITLTATQGTLTLATTGGLGFFTGDGIADVTMTFDATLEKLVAALNGMTLALPAHFTGQAAVRISVNDQGNVGVGGPLADSAAAYLNVIPNASNSAPVVQMPAPQRTAINVPIVLDSVLGRGIAVVDDAGNGTVRVTATASNGTITIDERLAPPATANTTFLGDQFDPALAMLPDGSHIVTWTGSTNGGGGSAFGIYAQRFDASGARLGAEWRVDSLPASGARNAPAVAADPSSGFVISWVSENQDGSGRGVYVRRYDLAGQAIGSEIRVNTTIAGDQIVPDVALTASGGFVVVWQSADASGQGIFMQRFDANREPVGAETLVNEVTAGDQKAPVVAMDAAGNFVVVWEGRDADSEGILARRYDAAGNALGGEFLVNTATVDKQTAPTVAMNASGAFVIGWRSDLGSNEGIYGRRYDASGTALGAEFRVSTTVSSSVAAASVAINDNGATVFSWQANDADDLGVYARTFDATGNGGRELLVNLVTTDDQKAPSVGLAANGSYRVVWAGDIQDGDKLGIGMQAMLRAGALTFTTGDGVDDPAIVFSGTLAEVNAALDGIVFKPNAGFVGVGRVTVSVDDLGNTGSGGAKVGSNSVDIVIGNSPLLDLDANNSSGATGADYRATFRPGLGPVLIADAVDATISDPNSANLTRLTVQITNLLDGTAEKLAALTNGTTIVASYNAATGTLLLTGSNSVANYQKVLRTITYDNTAATPSTAPRSITFVANDGTGDSNIATAIVGMGGSNTAPVSIADAFATVANQTLVVAANGVLANDSDGENDALTAVLVSSTSNGALTLNADGSFSYTPTAGYSGNDSFSYMASDGQSNSAVATVTITIARVNSAPSGADGSLAMAEDGALTLVRANFGFSDAGDTPADGFAGVLFTTLPGSGSLRLNGSLLAAGAFVDIADIDAGLLVYRPAADANGTVNIGFQVRDDGGSSNGGVDTDPTERWLAIAVSPEPDAPLLQSPIADQAVDEDAPFSFSFGPTTFTDPDAGDVLSYSATLAGGGALPGWLSFDAATRTFSGTPTNADVGTLTIRVTATDTTAASAIDEFDLTVVNVNDAPIVALPIADQSASQGTPFAFTFAAGSFSDIDVGDSLAYSAKLASGAALPGWLSFDAATRSFSGTPGAVDVGAITIRVTATDSGAASVFDDFVLTVANVNSAPTVAVPLPDASAVENSPFLLVVDASSFVDADAGDTLTYTATLASGAALPTWLSFDAATRTFSGTPGNADVGAITVRVTATDSASASAYDDFLITVDNVNDAPTLTTALPDQTATEDLPFSFTIAAGAFVDIDADDGLVYAATLASGAALPSWLGFDAATRTFSGTPANADVGAISVRVTATDGSGESAFGDFVLTVNNVNDAPTLNRAIADRGATMGVPVSFALPADTFVDIDAGDTLSWTATTTSGGALPAWLSFDAATRAFSGTPGLFDLGPVSIRVTATDGSLASVFDDFSINVVALNTAPTLDRAIVDQAATQDLPFSFMLPGDTFSDADLFDSLGYQAVLANGNPLPTWLSFDAATQTFSGTPGNVDVGTLSIRVTATDNGGASASDVFDLVVANVNDAPTLDNPLLNQSATQAAPFSYTFAANTFADIDAGDTLAYAAALAGGGALPSWLSFDAAARTFSGTPANADVGAITVRVTATDGSLATASGDFVLTVFNVNDAPTLVTPLADQAATQGVPFAFTVDAGAFADIDAGDGLFYSATLAGGAPLPSWLSFDAATRTFSGTPANADVGAITVRVTATDGSLASVFDDFVLTVANVNDAPVLVQPLPDQSATQGVPFSFTVGAGSFADIDAGDVLSYAATLANGAALPAWLSFDAATRTFSGTPANADVGSITVRVTATDGSLASVFDDFVLTVANVNDAPVLVQPLADQSATQGVPFSFTVGAGDFADIDAGDVLTYGATLANGAALPAWLSFDAATRTFSGTPGNADVGTITVRVTATDGSLASVFDDFELSVANVNDAPVLVQPLADQSATQAVPFSFTFGAGDFVDIDAGDVLTYGATLANGAALPSWLSFDVATRTFSGTPANADVGSITVRVTATDGSLASVFDDFELSVANVNDAPLLTRPIADRSAVRDIAFEYTLPADTFVDIDAGDTLNVTASLAGGGPLPAWLSFDATSLRFSGTPDTGDVGTITIHVTATDGSSASVHGEFDLHVGAGDSAPVLANPLADQSANQDMPFVWQLPADAFADADRGDVLSYSATLANGAALPAWLSFDAATRSFTGTPGNADIGSITVRVTATDALLAEVFDEFELSVANVNDAPMLVQPLADQSATQGVPFSFAVDAGAFADADSGDVLSYSATLSDGAALPSWLNFDGATRSFSGTPANADVGVVNIRVTVTDLAMASAFGDFTLTVANVNDAPTLVTPLADQSATQDVPFAFTVPLASFTDIDAGDALRWSATLVGGAALPAWLGFDNAARTFSGTPVNGDVGTVAVRVVATDLAGASAFGQFTLTVGNVNDAPTLVQPLAEQAATQDQPFVFTVPGDAFVDLDAGDTLSWSATLASGAALPDWLFFDAATHSFSGTPGNADVGTNAVRVTVTDRELASASGDFLLTVGDVNDAPVLTQPLHDQFATQGVPLDVRLPAGTFVDADAADQLLYSATLADGSALPAWLTFDASTRSFSGTPGNADVGAVTVRVTASDQASASAFGDLVLTVADVNDAPILLAPLPDQVATEDQPFVFVVDRAAFADIDAGDQLVFDAKLAGGSALPGWLRFDAATLRFSGTPGIADGGGNWAVDVIATDTAGASVAGRFQLQVLAINHAPRLALPIDGTSVTANEHLLLKLAPASFVDPDAGDVLVYRATQLGGSALPRWLRFDPVELSFSGQPAHADVGRLVIRIVATDVSGATAQAVFVVDVADVRALAEPFQPVFLEPEQAAPRTARGPAVSEPVTGPPASRGVLPAGDQLARRAAASGNMSLLGGATAEFGLLAIERKAAAAGEAARSGSRSDATLAALPAALFDELQVHSMSRLLLSDDLLGRFDDLQHQMQDLGEQQRRMLASSLAISGGLSLGYVVWLIRGGVLVSSMLSALPAWQLIDPMPVLAAGGAGARTRGFRWFGGADKPDSDEVEKLFDRNKPPMPAALSD